MAYLNIWLTYPHYPNKFKFTSVVKEGFFGQDERGIKVHFALDGFANSDNSLTKLKKVVQ